MNTFSILSRALRILVLVIAAILPLASRAGGPGDAGEFDLRSTLPLAPTQLARLRALVVADPEAAALLAELRAEAAPFLDHTPRPLRVIRYEGLVNTHPDRVADVSQLRELDHAAALLHLWQATGHEPAAAALRRFVLAWASAYRPTGNDVNENKLTPLFVAYEALRASFPDAERAAIDAWIARLGELHARAVAESNHLTNRYTKHLRLLALFARVLDRADWRAATEAGYRRFVANSLRADGTSLDLERRDTLTYHASALRPLIDLAVIAGPDAGPALYVWESPAGGSVKKSVDYVIPYASGEKTREEWKNSKVDLDRRRAAAGLEEYRPGRLYEPRSALSLIEEASFFAPSLTPLVLKLHARPATSRFASWRMVLNAACAP